MTRKLLELAERCEQASGGEQRALLFEAYELLSASKSISFDTAVRFTGFWLACAYLDAAMSLVPEGWHYLIRSLGYAEVYEREFANGDKLKHQAGTAATPALALCAASLRARAAQERK